MLGHAQSMVHKEKKGRPEKCKGSECQKRNSEFFLIIKNVIIATT